jgi:hypothetical protein
MIPASEEKAVRAVLRMARRKRGVTGWEVAKLLGVSTDPQGYRMRKVIRLAKDRGMVREGSGPSTVFYLRGDA